MNDEKIEGQIIERPAERKPSAEFGGFLMEAMRNPELTAEKLTALMSMRREVLADEAAERFMDAFTQFQAELPEVERDGTIELVKDGVSKGRVPFTTYEKMYAVLRPLFAKYGFSITFSSFDEKDGVRIKGWLMGHGHKSEPSSYFLPADAGPGRNAIQARGSSRSYAKRYITDDLCNVVRKGVDNDARGAQDQLIDATQVRELTQLLKATKTNAANFLKIMVNNAESLADVRERDFTRLKLALLQKQDSQKKGQK